MHLNLSLHRRLTLCVALAAGCGEPPANEAGKRAPAGAEADAPGEGVEERHRRASGKPRQRRYVCNVCGTQSAFKPVGKRQDAECPVCLSKERHRLLLHYMEFELKLFHQKLDVLHFSPDEAEEMVFRHQPNWHYVTTDYEHTEDLKLDLTRLDQPDESWDVLIIYHIFEHILDDQPAMREMVRVLRPGGRAFIQVPLEVNLKDNVEDPSVTDPAERAKLFGQSNHVRKYSIEGFRARLEAAGCVLEIVDYAKMLDSKLVANHRMIGEFVPVQQDQRIWMCTKPGGPAKVDAKVDAKADAKAAAPDAKAQPPEPAEPLPARPGPHR